MFQDLKPQVEESISKVLPSDDPLDAATFDPIEYVNRRFPTEESLSKLDQFSSNLANQIRRVDEEIYESIRNQAVCSKQTEKDVSAAKMAIRDLYEKIKDIRGKAEQSEVMVEEICKDIKQLDNAKRNLTTTITALHKLQTWVTGIDQLRLMVKTRNFDAAAHLLGAVTDLSKHFEGYANVPKVKRLHDAVTDIRAHLKDEVEDRFREVGALRVSDRTLGDEEDRQREMSRRARNLERLKPAARVVDAMGEEMRERVIKHFLEDQIREYEDRYGPNNSAGYNLKQVERRYMWYRLLERTFKAECEESFPPSWHMCHRLAFCFCEKTRDHLASMLDDDSDTHEMITALKLSVSFERSMCRNYEKNSNAAATKKKRRKSSEDSNMSSDYSSDDDDDDDDDSDDDDDDDDDDDVLMDDKGNVLDPKSVEGIRLKWKRQREQKERTESVASKAGMKEYPALDVRSMKGLVSSVFQPYMGKYVELERQNLSQTMDHIMKESSHETQNNIYVNALQMFNAMKQAMNRCKVVSKSQAYFSLQKEFKLCFEKYVFLDFVVCHFSHLFSHEHTHKQMHQQIRKTPSK